MYVFSHKKGRAMWHADILQEFSFYILLNRLKGIIEKIFPLRVNKDHPGGHIKLFAVEH